MSLPTTHRFSVRDYYRMAETGVLDPDARVELLEGEIHDMSPIGPLHGGVVNRLNRLFTSVAGDRFIVATQNPVRLNDYSEPQPDLALLKPAPDDYTTHHPAAHDVLLLVEVADTSLIHDRQKKLPAYAQAGIEEVWIVDLCRQQIEVYLEPAFTGYDSKRIFSAGDRVVPRAVANLSVDISELFK